MWVLIPKVIASSGYHIGIVVREFFWECFGAYTRRLPWMLGVFYGSWFDMRGLTFFFSR